MMSNSKSKKHWSNQEIILEEQLHRNPLLRKAQTPLVEEPAHPAEHPLRLGASTFTIFTCHPELEKFPSGALHASQNCSWLNKAFSRHGIRAEVDCGMIIGYYFDV